MNKSPCKSQTLTGACYLLRLVTDTTFVVSGKKEIERVKVYCSFFGRHVELVKQVTVVPLEDLHVTVSSALSGYGSPFQGRCWVLKQNIC